MTTIPQFVSVNPEVLDERRVSVHIKTANLPELNRFGACFAAPDQKFTSNISLNPDVSTPPPLPGNTIPAPPAAAAENTQADMTAFEQSKFPVVEVNLVDAEKNLVAHSMIIEHQEPDLSITLHIRSPQVGQTYTAFAELIYHQELVHVVSAPFVLAVNSTTEG